MSVVSTNGLQHHTRRNHTCFWIMRLLIEIFSVSNIWKGGKRRFTEHLFHLNKVSQNISQLHHWGCLSMTLSASGLAQLVIWRASFRLSTVFTSTLSFHFWYLPEVSLQGSYYLSLLHVVYFLRWCRQQPRNQLLPTPPYKNITLQFIINELK